MERVTVLANLPSASDRRSLSNIIDHSRWELQFAEEIMNCEFRIRSGMIGVVISDRWLADGTTWRDVLAIVERQPIPPAMVVADGNADERLWAEVLNLGCFDLLNKPFDVQEVFRVISSAWLSWKRRRDSAVRTLGTFR